MLKERLSAHLAEIVRERDPYLATAGYFYVRQYIRTQLAQWGSVQIDEFPAGNRLHYNYYLDLPARSGSHRQALVLIGAHYDTVPGTPGADDNATGLAVLLELARAFSTTPLRFPVRLIAFDLEEYGLVGSRYHAQQLHNQKQPIRLMLSLEMLGYCQQLPNSQRYPPGLKYFYPNQGNFIGLIGNLKTLPDLLLLTHRIRRRGTPCEWLPAGKQGRLVPETRRSDHAPFWDLGYPAILVTDTADLRNPHYHEPDDRLETLDLDFLTGVGLGLMAGLQKL